MTKERAGERVIKKIGSSHVIWFPESNRWMEFKEPAWFIYNKIETGENEQSITVQLTQRYGLPGKEALRFFRDIKNNINLSVRPPGGSEPGRGNETAGTVPVSLTDRSKSRRYVTRHYLVNKKHLTISYGSPLLEYYIHRPLAHLETGKQPADSLRIRLFEEVTGGAGDRSYYLQFEAPAGVSRSFSFKESGLLKHRLYTAITSHIYGIPEEGWMSFIHASAVTNGREAALLPSASGSGKSTMAALLQLPADKSLSGSHGDLFFMSDDFVAVAAESAKAYPFPAAITVKEGSFDVIAPYYDTDHDADAGYRGLTSSRVRYLCPRLPGNNPYAPLPVKNLIFIKHTPGNPFRLRKLDTLSALAAFHEEAWVSQNPVHAQRFIDWFVTLECHKLEYDDSRKAVQAIRELLK